MAHVPSSRTFSEVQQLPAYHAALPAIAERYHGLCVQNDRSSVDIPEEYTVFYGTEPPGMSVNDFLVRLCKYGHCSPQTLVVMVIFLERFLERTGCVVTSRSVHRLMLGAFIVAAKLRDDVYYTNVYYSSIGGLSPQKVNVMEHKMLFGISWDIACSNQEFKEVVAAITAKEAVWVQPRSGARRRASPTMSAVDAARLQHRRAQPQPVSPAPAVVSAPKVTKPAGTHADSGPRRPLQGSSAAPLRGTLRARRGSGTGARTAGSPPERQRVAEKAAGLPGAGRTGRKEIREVHPQTDDSGAARGW
eukprot:TRINITY_DN199_c0_g2_i1.p2 TRINITY_DN199_c0_g2~~TRINITY_DN199_c0_g2_i1.p2  ORF type:complete len:336 (+),score=112.45 TRINITY_DN199_c0_g2_i1:98-1009(+)